MAQPLYFLKNVRHEGADSIAHNGDLNRQLLKDLGLHETFRDVTLDECTRNPVPGAGPGGFSGMVLSYQTADRRVPKVIGYDPRLEWTEVGERVWIGIDHESPPSEEDLRRKRMIGGTVLGMSGGHYTIPTTRTKDGTSKLPSRIVFGESGMHLPIKPEYVKYWNATGDIISWFFDPEFRETCTDEDLAEIAVLNFGLNYRYSKIEQNVLGLIDTENLLTVIAWNCSLFESAEVVT